MSDGDVSVILPVYNGAAYLKEAVSTILAQSCCPREIIVVDDGSTDGTAAIVASFADKLTSIRQENKGPAAARNAGLRRAQGSLIAFLDADDLWLPTALEQQLDVMRAGPSQDVVWGLTERFFMAGADPDQDDWHGRPQWALTIGSMLFRHQTIEEIGGFDDGLRAGEDMDLLVRLRERPSSIKRHSAVVYRRRVHNSNLSGDRRAMIEAHYRVVGKALQRRRVGRPSALVGRE
jgi:glycosyltransferase involved in cell wall biosynthesis